MWKMRDKTLEGFEGEKIRRNFWVYAVLLSALGAMTFFGVCDPSSSRMGGRTGAIGGSAAVVQGEVITRVEFQRAYRSAYDRYQRMYQDAFDPAALKLAQTVIKDLVDDRAMYLSAVDLGLRASEAEVLAVLTREASFKDENGKFNAENFKAFLDNNGYTEASFTEEIRRNLTLQKFRRFVAETAFVSSRAAELDYRLAETKLDIEYLKFDPLKIEVKPSAADVDQLVASEDGKKRIKEYYDANGSEFNQPEQLRARHILVAFQGSRNATAEAGKRSKDDARKRAEEVLAKVKAPGADFAAIAKEMTDEAAGKTSGGDLKWFSRDAMVKEFSDVAFTLKPGELSGVVETPFGFHVIKAEERKDAVATKLEDAQRRIAETLLAKEQKPKVAKERAEKVLAALKAGTAVDAQLTEFGVAWAATGAVAADARYLAGIGSNKDVGDALSVLTKPGQVLEQPLDIRGTFFVLRLKTRTEADMARFDKDKKREMALSAAYSDGNAFFGALEKHVRDELDKKKNIWMNPDYLALDDRRASDSDTGG